MSLATKQKGTKEATSKVTFKVRGYKRGQEIKTCIIRPFILQMLRLVKTGELGMIITSKTNQNNGQNSFTIAHIETGSLVDRYRVKTCLQ